MSENTSEQLEIDTKKMARAFALRRRIKILGWLEVVSLGAGLGGLAAFAWLVSDKLGGTIGVGIAISALCAAAVIHLYLNRARKKVVKLYGEAVVRRFTH